MSTLPDLDPGGVSFLAYWNAIDQGGVSSIEPAEVTSAGIVNETTLYDNGVTGTFSISETGTPEGRFRVKNDGWFVAYVDRSATYDTQVQEPNIDAIRGPWDIINGWTNISESTAPPPGDLQNDNLERTINALYSQLPNAGSITYNVSDVGLYNYEYPDATTITHLSASTNDNVSAGFTYTSGTDRKWQAAVANIWGNNVDAGGSVSAPSGLTIVSAGTSEKYYGVIDVLAQNEAPNAGQEYTFSLNTASFTAANHSNLIVWG